MYKYNQNNNNSEVDQTANLSEQSTKNNNLSKEDVDALVSEFSSEDPISFVQDFSLLQATAAEDHLLNPTTLLNTRNSLSTTSTSRYSSAEDSTQSRAIMWSQYIPARPTSNENAIYAKNNEFTYDKDIVLDEGTFVPAGTRIIKMGTNRRDTEYYARSEDPEIKDQRVLRSASFRCKRLVNADGTFVPATAKIVKKDTKKNNTSALYPYFEITENGQIQVYTLTSFRHQQARNNKKQNTTPARNNNTLNISENPEQTKETRKKNKTSRNSSKRPSRSDKKIMQELLKKPTDLNEATISLLQSSFLTTETPVPEDRVVQPVPVKDARAAKPSSFTFLATSLKDQPTNTTHVPLNVMQPQLQTYQSEDEKLMNNNHLNASNVYSHRTNQKRKK